MAYVAYVSGRDARCAMCDVRCAMQCARDDSCGLDWGNCCVRIVVAFYVTRRDMRTEMRASNQRLAMFAGCCCLVWATVATATAPATTIAATTTRRATEITGRGWSGTAAKPAAANAPAAGQMSRTMGQAVGGSIFKEISGRA